MLCSVTKLARRFVTLWNVAHQAPLSMGFPGKNTGEGCHFLLQGTVLTQGSNLGLSRLLHRRWILCHWAVRKASWCCISKTCKWWELIVSGEYGGSPTRDAILLLWSVPIRRANTSAVQVTLLPLRPGQELDTIVLQIRAYALSPRPGLLSTSKKCLQEQ